MPSRRASLISRPSFGGRSRKSIGGTSVKDGAETTRKSQGGPHNDDGRETQDGYSSDVGSEKRFKHPHGVAIPSRLSVEVEAEGDDDVSNVGLSRVNSREMRQSSPPKTNGAPPQSQNINGIVAQDHHPFSEEDLALAMKRSHLAVPTRG